MATGAIRSGFLGTAALNTANVKPDIESVLQVLEPYQTPLLQWLWFGKRPAKVVKNAYGKYSWFEDELFPHQTAVTAAIIAASSPATLSLTTSNVGSIALFNVGDYVIVEETDEMGYVISNNGSTAEIGHPDGSTGMTALTDGTGQYYIKVIGSRNSEYDGVRTSVYTTEVEKFNYLNIFSESVSTTGRMQAGENYTDGLSHSELVEKRIKELKLQIERYFMFAPSQGYTTSGNYRTTYGHGFLGRVTSNVETYSILDEDTFDNYLKQIFAKGSNTRMHMCGSDQLAAINKFVKDRYELSIGGAEIASKYGIHMKQYITPFGLVDLVWNPVMDGKFSKYGFTIDPESIRMRYMDNDKKGSRKFRLQENVETPGIDGTQTKILFDIGLEIHNEEKHGILMPNS